MGTQVIIDARKRQVRASLEAPGNGTVIFAVDLIGDTWADYRYFSEQAARYEGSREFQKRNRYMRAAIAFMFSHFDGVVTELFGMLQQDSDFNAYLPPKKEPRSLKAKMLAVQSFLVQGKGIALPIVDLDMKLLRDIVNHPSITKESRSAGGGDTLLYNGADVYGIAIEDVRTAATAIDWWLDAACEATGYERFRDTERLCLDFSHALGLTPEAAREF